MNTTKDTYSRIGYCPCCAKERRPLTNQLFVVHGTNGFHIYEALRVGELGYTPHIYVVKKRLGENIVVERICGMHDCGMNVKWDDNTGNWKIAYHASQWRRFVFSIEQWNALVNLKNLGYEI